MRDGINEIRSFVALEVPNNFRSEIIDIINQYRRICPQEIKWVEEQNLHFTLQFFGTLNKDNLVRISVSLTQIFDKLPAFSVYGAKVELIPKVTIHNNNPRLIWVRVDYDDYRINNTVKEMRHIMKSLSLPVENKPFKMHITLGRIKKSLNLEQVNTISQVTLSETRWKINYATLYESKLHACYPEYIALQSYKLQTCES